MSITTTKNYTDKKDWLEDYRTHHRVLKKGEKFADDEVDDANAEYPKIDQQCINDSCDSNQCYYYTQQTRSADEGQTLFFRCVKCK